VKTGSTLSSTSTETEEVVVLPEPSVAVRVTRNVAPASSQSNELGEAVAVRISQLSSLEAKSENKRTPFPSESNSTTNVVVGLVIVMSGDIVSKTVIVVAAVPSLLLVGFVTVSVTGFAPISPQSKTLGEML